MYSNRSKTNWKTYKLLSNDWIDFDFDFKFKENQSQWKKKIMACNREDNKKNIKKIILLKELVCHAVNFFSSSVYLKNWNPLFDIQDITQQGRKEKKRKCKISDDIQSTL